MWSPAKAMEKVRKSPALHHHLLLLPLLAGHQLVSRIGRGEWGNTPPLSLPLRESRREQTPHPPFPMFISRRNNWIGNAGWAEVRREEEEEESTRMKGSKAGDREGEATHRFVSSGHYTPLLCSFSIDFTGNKNISELTICHFFNVIFQRLCTSLKGWMLHLHFAAFLCCFSMARSHRDDRKLEKRVPIL